MAPAAGTALLSGRYQIGPLLGRGGMADVYDGFDTRLQRRVAVKCLRPSVAADPEARVRFEREARAAARLNHPAVVRLYDIGEDGGVPYLVMERMPGPTLADRLARGPLDQQWLRGAVLQVLGALGAAHEAGILHRDIKPGNVLPAPDGSIKVADFGIAAVADRAPGDEHHTSTGVVIGTPAYLAPERAQGKPATVQADLYAVGVLLYEGLTGHKPYDGPTPLATAAAAQQGGAVPIQSYRPDADPGMVAVANRAMSLNPDDRFPSAAAMATALSAPAPRAPAPTVLLPALEATAPLAPPARHRGPRTIAALVGTAALVIIVVVLWPFGGRNVGPPAPVTTTTVFAPTTLFTPPTTSANPGGLTTTTRPRRRPHRSRTTVTSVSSDGNAG